MGQRARVLRRWLRGRVQHFLVSGCGIYKVGREALGAWIAFIDAFDEFALGLDQLVDAGEGVVALVWMRGRGRASGANVDAKVGAIFTVRGSKVVRWEMTDRAKALEAAGLRE